MDESGEVRGGGEIGVELRKMNVKKGGKLGDWGGREERGKTHESLELQRSGRGRRVGDLEDSGEGCRCEGESVGESEGRREG